MGLSVTPGDGLLLSVCLIVRNEAWCISRCLESVKAIASEILVLDTGSDDQTVQISHSFGARVYQMVWLEHFSQVRNALLPRARGRWILWLDADEWLTPEHAQQLQAFLTRANSSLYALRWRQDAMADPGAKVVLFPGFQGVRYLGRVHEIPWDPSGRLPVRFLPQFEVQHNPAISPRDPRKLAVARHLLSLDLNHPDVLERFHALRHWARSELILHKDALARLSFEQAWELFLTLPPACWLWGQSVLEPLLFLAWESGDARAWTHWRALLQHYYPEYPALNRLPLTI